MATSRYLHGGDHDDDGHDDDRDVRGLKSISTTC